ncbi:MAG: hemerythrin domain-containing protein, partial [Mucilaginibacter sp.]
KIKEGLKKNVPLSKILDYVNFFWTQHLQEHFKEEETLLFDKIDDELTRQAKSEHQIIGERIDHLNQHGNEKEKYLAFADFLTQHIRFEERTLFPHLEATLPEAILKQAGDYLSAQALFVDNYPDEFWSKSYPSL